MKYIGDLYGKVGRKTYFPLYQTSQGVDKLESDLDNTRALLKEALEYIDGAIEFHDAGYTYREPNRVEHEAILAKLREAKG